MALRRAYPIIIAILTLLILFSIVVSIPHQEVEVNTYKIMMETTLINNGSDIWSISEEYLSIYLFHNTSYQTAQLLDTDPSILYKASDEDGNPYVTLKLDRSELKPGENLTFQAVFKASKRKNIKIELNELPGELSDIPDELREKYCKGSAVWHINNTELRDLAFELASGRNTVLDIVLNYVKWIKSNVKYAFEQEVPLYPNETYRERLGDCDDQAILLITLCRIYGIPAYLQIGCIYNPSIPTQESIFWNGHFIYKYEKIAWHGWAIVYIPPWGWLPIDLTYSSTDPMSTITNAAINSEFTLLYLNISDQDYVGDSRRERERLERGNLIIKMFDRMSEYKEETLSVMITVTPREIYQINLRRIRYYT